MPTVSADWVYEINDDGTIDHYLLGPKGGRSNVPVISTDASGNTVLAGADGEQYSLNQKYQDPAVFTGDGFKALTRRAAVYADFIDTANLTVQAWTGATGTVTVSREVLYNGRPTLKVVMPSACTRVEIGVSSGVTFPSDHFDSMSVGVYVPALAALGVAQIYIGDSTYTALQLCTTDLAASGVVGWNHLRFDNRAAAINEPPSSNPGTVTSGNVAQCKVRINKTAGTDSTIYLTSPMELESSRAKIVFTADDGYDECYSWLKDQAVLYGVPWALGIDASYLDTAGFITSAQIAEMNALDPVLFQFYSHGSNNQGYTDLGAAAYAASVVSTGSLLSSLGVAAPLLYHPYVKGQRGNDLDALLTAAGVKVARLAVGVSGETFKPAVMDRLYGGSPRLKMRIGLSLESTVSLATAKTAIDNACTVGGVLMIMAHEFVTSGASGLQWNYADVIALMAYAKKKENAGSCDVIDVKTLDKITEPVVGLEQTGYV